MLIKILEYNRDYSSIEKYFDILEKLYPNGIGFLKTRGKYYLKNRKYKEAEEYFRKLIEIIDDQKKTLKYQIHLAGCLYLQNKNKEILEIISPIHDKNVKNFKLNYMLIKFKWLCMIYHQQNFYKKKSLIYFSDNDEFKLLDIEYIL